MPEFGENPILNSPYWEPSKHWRLDGSGKPTGDIDKSRRRSAHLIPVPAARRKTQAEAKLELDLEANETREISIVNKIRGELDVWRKQPLGDWGVTEITKQLITYWRGESAVPRPFFCQVESVETLIWLNEVAPYKKSGRKILDEIKAANNKANPELLRLACKMATGSGKTTVMAMMIAYHTLNRIEYPYSKKFSKNFLIITPGITIKDRLRVLLPSDPQSYFKGNRIVPKSLSANVRHAKVVITNFHAFKPRATRKVSKAEMEILKGNDGEFISTVESPRQMLKRVCDGLLGAENIIVMNDEAHHCYRQKQGEVDALSTPPPPREHSGRCRRET
ncbi:MAG: DEAD/DEAH box helicase family protein [Gammaproteobacteria bacterium]|nr:DEAD/DEAH box helicase family protein [Gammaproteobacteria bacterium]